MRTISLIVALMFCTIIYGQKTHVIEPSILEVSYHVTCGDNTDDYALRIGKNVSEYFSKPGLRFDSLGSNQATAMIVINEMLEEVKNKEDKSKQRPSSPGYRDYLYRNLDKGCLSTYTQIFDSHYRIVEDIPVQDWSIDEDSTKQIIGYDCHSAKAHFRGRDWRVWYTEEIPLSIGPWKFGGLPGLILAAECDGYMSIVATNIRTNNLSPVTFYNFWNKKFEDIDRVKYLKAKNDPKSYPTHGNAKTSLKVVTMELE